MAKTDAKCKCNIGWAVLSWILKALGLWALVAGFATQFTSSAPADVNATILGWYFAGFLLFGISKITDWKAKGNCALHANVS
ncbi:MAG: hypothetical protein HYW27_02725 [Candidatus Aenigmarchaeota archaeon]|nr:hypothetical protein [Candidatus Aenigmarchaeota archaeon]